MIYFFLVLFLVLNAADAFITVYAMNKGYREVNPILNKLFTKVGVKAGLAIVKVPVSVGAIYAVVVEQAQLWFVLALVIPYALLLLWNLYQLKYNKVT